MCRFATAPWPPAARRMPGCRVPRRHQFLVSGFGLPPDTFAKLAADCPNLLTHGDVWTAGCAMLFFKSMGWRNRDIAQRIVGWATQLGQPAENCKPQGHLEGCQAAADPQTAFVAW